MQINSDFQFLIRGGYNYLAIGNSITVHPITDFWWGEWGMAATKASSDYYHLVLEDLQKKYNNVNSVAWNYSVWENQAHDRTETYIQLDEFLDADINLITIQLSENVSDLTSFGIDFESLLGHIQDICPNARIIVIDDFWNGEKSEIKRNVCEKKGICFIDLSDLRGKEEYMVGIGTAVEGNDGIEHIVEHSGVAVHPNDNAMLTIAERIIDEVE